ncbi:HIT-like domain-containing protein [Gymnopilus junonius]|uniref:HIT-like domain-containing protein n=1 Tax=Gymnopilus junonius TaxID=109634 RepID=A0A9P5NNY9_GYMJU|nr:HIT-like domain-containing protein [Gymnopilus junonius]
MFSLVLSVFSPFTSITKQAKMENESKALDVPDWCKFCKASVERGFNIVYEDASFLAFEDRKPASRHHYLVVPKQHIESVRLLKSSDVDLVKNMEIIGHTILSNLDVPISMRVMGFHIPPFNSVYHLHLHVQGLPYRSARSASKYLIRPGFGGYSKGLSWFVEISQAIQILERRNFVGVLPC